jgi:hypothetical protein
VVGLPCAAHDKRPAVNLFILDAWGLKRKLPAWAALTGTLGFVLSRESTLSSQRHKESFEI